MIKKIGKTIEELSEASKVPLEHMFNSHEKFSAEWCFNTRASEEGNVGICWNQLQLVFP